MSDLAEKLAEQLRLVRQAPTPHLAAWIITSGLMFGAFQWGYGRILEQKDAALGTLYTRVSALTSERDDLRKQLADKAANPSGPASSPRDPDAIYQLGSEAARALGGVVDQTTGTVHFMLIQGNPNFNSSADMDYRKFTLAGCSCNAMTFAIINGIRREAFPDVICRISGLHP